MEGIIIANPNNPTGRVWTKEEMKKLYVRCNTAGSHLTGCSRVALTKQYGATLILDEIYCDMVFNGVKHYSPLDGVHPWYWLQCIVPH